MFHREPRKLKTQELSLAPLFQPLLVKHYNSPNTNIGNCQVSLQPYKEIVTYKNNFWA